MGEHAMAVLCAYSLPGVRECGSAVVRARWTVYGGGLKAVRLCSEHRPIMAQRRGVELTPLCPSCGRALVDATGDWQCHRCERLWPAGYFAGTA